MNDNVLEQISCPCCNRDFELPRRYMINSDDFDFKPIPRLLSCLHTVCHSCLEEQRERNTKGQIVCPICKNKDVIKGVKYLPLDISILKQIVRSAGSESLTVCCQCYEDVASFSFCLTCSTALCDFHHNDHKLSVISAKHNVQTFKEIAANGIHIDYTFPPIACPEIVMQDCSLYCQDCLHVISPQAMIANHRDHQVEDCKDLFPVMKQTVKDAATQSKQNCAELKARIDKTQQLLKELDKNEEVTAAEITREFNQLRRKLESRERELLDRVEQVVQEKRFQLTEQLSLLSDLNEDCQQVVKTAEALLSDTTTKSAEGVYLVSATETVEFRSDLLNEQVEIKTKSLTDVDPTVSSHFMVSEVTTFKALVASFGSISSSSADRKAKKKEAKGGAGDHDVYSRQLNKPPLNIRFSVHIK
jgi:hypothetical protein